MASKRRGFKITNLFRQSRRWRLTNVPSSASISTLQVAWIVFPSRSYFLSPRSKAVHVFPVSALKQAGEGSLFTTRILFPGPFPVCVALYLYGLST